jgi:hypothetical protein
MMFSENYVSLLVIKILFLRKPLCCSVTSEFWTGRYFGIFMTWARLRRGQVSNCLSITHTLIKCRLVLSVSWKGNARTKNVVKFMVVLYGIRQKSSKKEKTGLLGKWNSRYSLKQHNRQWVIKCRHIALWLFVLQDRKESVSDLSGSNNTRSAKTGIHIYTLCPDVFTPLYHFW